MLKNKVYRNTARYVCETATSASPTKRRRSRRAVQHAHPQRAFAVRMPVVAVRRAVGVHVRGCARAHRDGTCA
jgi:hypothetical protein